jgi:hypothetical protein
MTKLGNIDIRASKEISLYKQAMTANTDILATDYISDKHSTCIITLQFTPSVSGVLSIIRKQGTGTSQEKLLSGGNLIANAMYLFTFAMDPEVDKLNIQFSNSGTCNMLLYDGGGPY